MDDLISRQAAIYAIRKIPVSILPGGILLGDVLETIRQLPSAQPDNQVHLCDSCSYTYPECPSVYTDMIFGNGTGNDNICACSKYLPPAHPEQNLDEWCTNCKEYDHENSCCHRWTKVIRQTRRELQDEFVMTAVDGTLWVTVDDVQKVGRVIVDEEKSKFCRQFYMDAQPEPCEDAVSREEVLNCLEWQYPDKTPRTKIMELPPVTPKQCTGKWIRNGWAITCSECGYDMPYTVRNFCPNCGAKMEGDAE